MRFERNGTGREFRAGHHGRCSLQPLCYQPPCCQPATERSVFFASPELRYSCIGHGSRLAQSSSSAGGSNTLRSRGMCSNISADGGQILRALLWFPFGPARSLLIASGIVFIGVLGLVALAVWQRSILGGIVAAFVFMSLPTCLAAGAHCWQTPAEAGQESPVGESRRPQGRAGGLRYLPDRRSRFCRRGHDTAHALSIRVAARRAIG